MYASFSLRIQEQFFLVEILSSFEQLLDNEILIYSQHTVSDLLPHINTQARTRFYRIFTILHEKVDKMQNIFYLIVKNEKGT